MATGTSSVSGGGSASTSGFHAGAGASVVTGGGSVSEAVTRTYGFTESARLPLWSENSTFIADRSYNESARFPLWSESSALKNGKAFAEVCLFPLWTETGSLDLPAFVEIATFPLWMEQGRFEAAVSAEFRAWPLNLRHQALTEYTNFPLNSFANFNGECLAASADGIFALTGDDDAGVKIPARIRLAMTDLDIAELKRLEDTFVSYRSDGRLVVTVVVEDGLSYDYPLEPTGRTGMYQARVKVGRGLKMNYVCIEIGNFEGAAFDLDAIRTTPVILSRMVG